MLPFAGRLVAGFGLAALVAACGGTAVVTTTTAPSATTTTVETTTTTAPPSTVPPDTHPGFGVSWAAVWPPEGAEATYRVLRGEEEQVLTARLDYGVEWAGGTWDCLTLGTALLGETGMAWYFDRSDPWVLRLAGADAFFTNAGGANLERAVFAEPLLLDLSLLPAQPATAQGRLTIASEAAAPPFLTLDYALEVTADGPEVRTVPAGAIEGTWHIRIALGIGGQPAGPGADLWVHPDYLLVAWEEAGIFYRMELATPWH